MKVAVFVGLLFSVHETFGAGLGGNCVANFNEVSGFNCNSDTTITGFAGSSTLVDCVRYCNDAVPADKYAIACNFGTTSQGSSGPCSVIVADTPKYCTSLYAGQFRRYTNCQNPPPTPQPSASPTKFPTKSPTFECYASSTCGTNEYCAGATQTCEQTACANDYECDGLFMSGRLSRCSDSGFCEDLFEGTCINTVDCENQNTLKKAARDSVGVLTHELTLTNLTTAREVISDLKAATTANNTITQDISFKITGSETVYLEQALFTQVNNDQAIHDAITTVLFGLTGKQTVTITQVNGPSARRALQAAGEIEITATYEVDEAVYDLFPTGSFDAPGFVAALEAALSLGAGNVTVTDIDGSISISYVVTNEATGSDPLSEQNFDELNVLEAELAILESTIQTQFGLNDADLSTAVVDKCGDRDCNGRGTCDPATGVCLCDSTDYWGINCETLVDCTTGTNVGLDGKAYCECPYPNSGQRCTTANACVGCV